MNTITVTAVVKNVGAAQAGASTLRLRIGSTDTTHGIPALAVGATATVTRTVGPLAAAAYVATAWADDNRVIVESRETNNSAEDSFVVNGPDLRVSSLYQMPPNPTSLDTISVNAIVMNTGAAPAGASTLSLKIGGETTPTTHAIPALAVGGQWGVIRTMGTMAAASYTMTAQADVNGAVAESNELNNGNTKSFTVLLPPDLVVDSLTHSPASPTMVDMITATVVVKNTGASTARDSTLRLDWDGGTGAFYEYFSIGPLAPGWTSTVTKTVGPWKPGSRGFFAKADYYNSVAESNEINNIKGLEVIVRALPDLVTSLSYEIIGIPGLKYFRVTRVVTNNGPGDAPSSWLDWMIYYPGGTGGGGSSRIDPLAAGESYVFSYNFRLLSEMPAGTWVFTLYSHGVLEWKYNNNNATMTYIR
jgi:subtilase family serine protease